MTFSELQDQRNALVRQIEDLFGALTELEPVYDKSYVEHLLNTGDDGYMNRAQISLYAGITPGRVSNIWSSGALASEKQNGVRVSLRSDVDVMIKNRWARK